MWTLQQWNSYGPSVELWCLTPTALIFWQHLKWSTEVNTTYTTIYKMRYVFKYFAKVKKNCAPRILTKSKLSPHIPQSLLLSPQFGEFLKNWQPWCYHIKSLTSRSISRLAGDDRVKLYTKKYENEFATLQFHMLQWINMSSEWKPDWFEVDAGPCWM